MNILLEWLADYTIFETKVESYGHVLQAFVTKSCDQALETIVLIGQLLANDDCALQRRLDEPIKRFGMQLNLL